MLLTIHNLPLQTTSKDVKQLLLSKCGLKNLILDNLENEGGGMKVTVGLAEEEDAAIMTRKINGLYYNGQQLYVQDIRQKRKLAEQPYRASPQQELIPYKPGQVTHAAPIPGVAPPLNPIAAPPLNPLVAPPLNPIAAPPLNPLVAPPLNLLAAPPLNPLTAPPLNPLAAPSLAPPLNPPSQVMQYNAYQTSGVTPQALAAVSMLYTSSSQSIANPFAIGQMTSHMPVMPPFGQGQTQGQYQGYSQGYTQQYNQQNQQHGQQYNQPDQQFNQHGQQFNQPDQQFNQPDQQFNQPGQQFNQPGQQFNQPGQQFNQHGQQLDHSGQQFNQPDQQFNQPDQQFNQPGQQFNQPGQQIDQRGLQANLSSQQFYHLSQQINLLREKLLQAQQQHSGVDNTNATNQEWSSNQQSQQTSFNNNPTVSATGSFTSGSFSQSLNNTTVAEDDEDDQEISRWDNPKPAKRSKSCRKQNTGPAFIPSASHVRPVIVTSIAPKRTTWEQQLEIQQFKDSLENETVSNPPPTLQQGIQQLKNILDIKTVSNPPPKLQEVQHLKGNLVTETVSNPPHTLQWVPVEQKPKKPGKNKKISMLLEGLTPSEAKMCKDSCYQTLYACLRKITFAIYYKHREKPDIEKSSPARVHFRRQVIGRLLDMMDSRYIEKSELMARYRTTYSPQDDYMLYANAKKELQETSQELTRDIKEDVPEFIEQKVPEDEATWKPKNVKGTCSQPNPYKSAKTSIPTWPSENANICEKFREQLRREARLEVYNYKSNIVQKAAVAEINAIRDIMEDIRREYCQDSDRDIQEIFKKSRPRGFIFFCRKFLKMHMSKRLNNAGPKLLKVWGEKMMPRREVLEPFLIQYQCNMLEKRSGVYRAAFPNFALSDQLVNMGDVDIGEGSYKQKVKFSYHIFDYPPPKQAKCSPGLYQQIVRDYKHRLIEYNDVDLLDKNWRKQKYHDNQKLVPLKENYKDNTENSGGVEGERVADIDNNMVNDGKVTGNDGKQISNDGKEISNEGEDIKPNGDKVEGQNDEVGQEAIGNNNDVGSDYEPAGNDAEEFGNDDKTTKEFGNNGEEIGSDHKLTGTEEATGDYTAEDLGNDVEATEDYNAGDLGNDDEATGDYNAKDLGNDGEVTGNDGKEISNDGEEIKPNGDKVEGQNDEVGQEMIGNNKYVGSDYELTGNDAKEFGNDGKKTVNDLKEFGNNGEEIGSDHKFTGTEEATGDYTAEEIGNDEATGDYNAGDLDNDEEATGDYNAKDLGNDGEVTGNDGKEISNNDKEISNKGEAIDNEGESFGNDGGNLDNDNEEFGNDNEEFGRDGEGFNNVNEDIGNDGDDFGNEDEAIGNDEEFDNACEINDQEETGDYDEDHTGNMDNIDEDFDEEMPEEVWEEDNYENIEEYNGDEDLEEAWGFKGTNQMDNDNYNDEDLMEEEIDDNVDQEEENYQDNTQDIDLGNIDEEDLEDYLIVF